MMIFSKKSFRLVPLYLLYIGAVLCIVWAARSLFQGQLTTQIFADKVYCYLIVPPFVLGISLLDESIKKPCIIRMESRLHALFYLLFQQYLLAALYLIAWFVLIALFAHEANEQISVIDLFFKYIRYLLSMLVFANLADLLKRLNIKALSTVPYVTAYILLLLEIQAIAVITNRYGRSVKLMFSWVFYHGIAGEETIKEYMRLFALDPASKQTMRRYSLGMKQKIGIIQALMENPDILILDEPFNALDEQSVLLLRDLLRNRRDEGKLIIVTSHHKDDIEAICDNVMFMQDGKMKSA